MLKGNQHLPRRFVLTYGYLTTIGRVLSVGTWNQNVKDALFIESWKFSYTKTEQVYNLNRCKENKF